MILTRILFCVLPVVSAVPLDLGGITNAVGEVINQPVAGLLPIDQILQNPANLVSNINKVLGDLIPVPVDSATKYSTSLGSIRKEIHELDDLFVTFAGLFQAIESTYIPRSISELLQKVEATLGNGTNGVTLKSVGELLLNGLSTVDLTQNVLAAYLSPSNSYDNNNPYVSGLYPRKSEGDAAYTVSEASLRSALYIPSTFTYGRKRPILFVPGTGVFGGVNFLPNLGKLLSEKYDPVYLNVPGAMYNDTQINAEYIAYATNYLSALRHRNDLALIAWSQGNLDTQWVFQYWPSTRSVVTDFISISADFHGTALAYFLDPAFPDIVPVPPSIVQQKYDSGFVRTLRNGGGDSPYVPSTSVWSITDEIVQPQYEPFASAAYLTQDLPGSQPTCPLQRHDNVQYTNNEIQHICAGRPAGGVYLHEGVLFNPLAYALVVDALENDGPGRVERLDLDEVCNQVAAPGLSLEDVLATEGLIPLAALNLLLYPGKVLKEPSIRSYAANDNACS